MNGKGDKSRVTDTKRYRENYEAIRWRKVGNVSLLEFAGRWKWKQKKK